jgi:hypothetical protein
MTDDQQADHDELDADRPLNRAERRAQRHRKATDGPQDNLQPHSANNPGFNRRDEFANPAFGEVKDSVTGREDQDQTNLTGAGTGGATETGERLPHHEAMPSPQNQPNS